MHVVGVDVSVLGCTTDRVVDGDGAMLLVGVNLRDGENVKLALDGGINEDVRD